MKNRSKKLDDWPTGLEQNTRAFRFYFWSILDFISWAWLVLIIFSMIMLIRFGTSKESVMGYLGITSILVYYLRKVFKEFDKVKTKLGLPTPKNEEELERKKISELINEGKSLDEIKRKLSYWEWFKWGVIVKEELYYREERIRVGRERNSIL